HGRGVPGGVGDKVVHRLVAGADMTRVHARGHGLDTLPVPGQTQAGDIRPQGGMPILVAEGRGQLVHIRGEAMGASRLGYAHTLRLPAYPMIPLTFLTQ